MSMSMNGKLPVPRAGGTLSRFQGNYAGMYYLESHHGNEIIELNVGGMSYATRYQLLATSSSHYFQLMFQVDKGGRVVVNSANVIQDRHGRVFIDRDGELFRYVLQFLRDGRRVVLPDDVSLLRQISREAEFFGLVELQALVAENIDVAQQAKLQGDPRESQQQEAIEEMIQVMKKVSQQLNLTNLNSLRR